jgi:hypothetical protein
LRFDDAALNCGAGADEAELLSGNTWPHVEDPPATSDLPELAGIGEAAGFLTAGLGFAEIASVWATGSIVDVAGRFIATACVGN